MLLASIYLVTATFVVNRTFYNSIPKSHIGSPLIIHDVTEHRLSTLSTGIDGLGHVAAPEFFNTLTLRVLIFDPNNIAPDNVWYEYAGKGNFYQCLMECTIDWLKRVLETLDRRRQRRASGKAI